MVRLRSPQVLSLLAAIALLLPSSALAITGDAARFDFSAGQPTTVDDTTTTCNNQATVRYDFTAGMPAPMLDTTATCTAVSTTPSPTILIKGGSYVQKGGRTVVK